MKLKLSNDYFSIAVTMLQQAKTVKLQVAGNSMLPFIKSGEEVELRPYLPSSGVKTWSCALFSYNEHYIIHRCVGKRGEDYVMMGDGNLKQKELVSDSQIYGILTTVKKSDGTIVDCSSTPFRLKAILWYRCRFMRRLLLKFLSKSRNL